MNDQSFKNITSNKGKVYPLVNLKGKPYLEVKYRILLMREDHPSWSISSKIHLISADGLAKAVIMKATIKDEKGTVIATGHAREEMSGFRDFIEKAETAAIGRALGFAGYGTEYEADTIDVKEAQRSDEPF